MGGGGEERRKKRKNKEKTQHVSKVHHRSLDRTVQGRIGASQSGDGGEGRKERGQE